jgi:hypothetical protein
MILEGFGLCKAHIRKIIKDAGYTVRTAKKVLTGTHLRRDTVIPQWFQASKATAASDGHAVHC